MRHHVKFLGDGLMTVAILGRGHNCDVARQFLCDLTALSDAMNTAIDGMLVYPKPVGFRTRVVAGQVSRIKTPEGDIDYVGYAVNLSSRLLRVQENTRLICHESVKDIIGTKDGLEFKKVKVSRHDIDGVDFEDLDGLWEFKCLNK
jgi:class 3 adenylate cyclase